MGEKKFILSQEIPANYTILKITTIDNEIIEVGAVKVKNHKSIGKYIGYFKPNNEINEKCLHSKNITNEELENAESIDTVIPRILNMIGTDTVIYMNTNRELDLLKSKCESIGLQFNNTIINGRALKEEIPDEVKYFVCNLLEILSLF